MIEGSDLEPILVFFNLYKIIRKKTVAAENR